MTQRWPGGNTKIVICHNNCAAAMTLSLLTFSHLHTIRGKCY